MSVDVPPDDEALHAASERLGRALRRRGWRLATAESCTGGLVGHIVTALAGASDYYTGGAICYADRTKEAVLAVPHDLIVEHGAVSSSVAAAMADGVRRRFGVEVGVSVTGIAGPDGAGSHKPVGLTYLGVVCGARPAQVEQHVWPFDRDGNKRASALRLLELAADQVEAAEA